MLFARLFLIFVIYIIPVALSQGILKLLPPLWRRYYWVTPSLWHRAACWTLNIQITVTGHPLTWKEYTATPTLFLGNHIGIRDILVIGGIFPLSFVAKNEIKSWPVLGTICHLHRTMFIKREAADTLRQQKLLLQRLREGVPLIFFPEGTTSNGTEILPFKPPLFQICPVFNQTSDKPLRIIPLTLTYTHYDDQPIQTQEERDHIAYYGDMETLPHLKGLFQAKRTRVQLHVHAPLSTAGKNRKEIARDTYNIMNETFQKKMNGPLTKAPDCGEKEVA